MTIAPSLTSADLAVAMAATTRGDVVTQDDPSYPAACFGYVSAGEDAPEIVVIAADACDVAAAVRLAARSGRRVAVQATGHTAPAGGVGTILVVTRLLARVSIDPEARMARMARVGAGSSWRQVLAAARAFGLAPEPSQDGDTARSPHVRTFAFAPDHVREFEVVTTAGAILQVDADRDPERFGALRGTRRLRPGDGDDDRPATGGRALRRRTVVLRGGRRPGPAPLADLDRRAATHLQHIDHATAGS